MRKSIALSASAAMVLALAGACSKPASETAGDAAANSSAAASSLAADTENATTTAGGALDNAAAPGGAVSAPQSPQNDAINGDANKNEATQTPGSNSFTEGQARGHIENAGYTNVTGLTKTADGLWKGKAMKDGKSVDVSLDFKGAVSAK